MAADQPWLRGAGRTSVIHKELLAPCGIYCGVCGVYIAHRDDNLKFKERLSTTLGMAPEQVVCQGCRSEEVLINCLGCKIRQCVAQKKYEGCIQCSDFPCGFVNQLPLPFKTVVLRAVPSWRKIGAEAHMEREYRRYKCPQCGYPLFMGATRCRICREPVNLD